MAWASVASYNLGYSITNKQFFFYYTLTRENQRHQLFPSAQELMALADMFKNNAPISFNADGQYFVSELSAAARKKIAAAQGGNSRRLKAFCTIPASYVTNFRHRRINQMRPMSIDSS